MKVKNKPLFLVITVVRGLTMPQQLTTTTRLSSHDVLAVKNQDTTEDLVVIYPGNPGIPEYYQDLASELASLTCSTVAVVGWLGFSARAPLLRPWWRRRVDLEAQISHGHQKLIELAKGYRNVAVVGHSIGALVAMEMLKQKTVDIRAVVKVTPFIAANSESPDYRKKWQLISTPGLSFLVIALAFLLRLLPQHLRGRIMALIGQNTDHMDSTATDLTLDAMTRPPNLDAFLSMGYSEFQSPRILHGPDLSWLPHDKDKVAVVYANGTDVWVRPNAPALMQEAGVHTVSIDSDHDIPTRCDSSKACASVIADFLLKKGLGSSSSSAGGVTATTAATS